MTYLKKSVSLLLALVMMFVMAIPVFATGADGAENDSPSTPAGTGSITIANAVEGQKYTIYRILDLKYNTNTNAFYYTVADKWKSFIETNGYFIVEGDDKHVKENPDSTITITIKEFAKAALEEATKAPASGSTDPQKIMYEYYEVASENGSVVFKNLPLGYYLVDSTLGTLCSINTVNPTATIEEKNVTPTNTKTVEEDASGDYVARNDADIGQTVNFKSTITAQDGAENYVFYDTMSEGLSFSGENSVLVKLNDQEVNENEYTISLYSSNEETTTEAGQDSGASQEEYTFKIEFTKSFCDSLKKDDTIVISYSAVLNEKAVVGDTGNINKSKLKYGDSNNTQTTPPSETKTYTWDVDVFKYAKNGETETPLAGAKFTLRKTNGTDPIALIREKDENEKDTNTYRVAKTGETGITEITTDGTGRFTIKGLDSDTYLLTEEKAPENYSKLTSPITIIIDENGKTSVGGTDVDEVKVLNQKGTALPSTGGAGTTLFYLIGGILAVGAAVLLVTKRRMGNDDE